MSEDKNIEHRDTGAGEDAESRFAYSVGEEVLYEDEHGNLLTPEEFREHLKRPETDEEREARYRHARETQRRLLGDDAPPESR